MTNEEKLELIKEQMKKVKLRKMKDSQYWPSTGVKETDSKQALYGALFNIQEILNDRFDTEPVIEL